MNVMIQMLLFPLILAASSHSPEHTLVILAPKIIINPFGSKTLRKHSLNRSLKHIYDAVLHTCDEKHKSSDITLEEFSKDLHLMCKKIFVDYLIQVKLNLIDYKEIENMEKAIEIFIAKFMNRIEGSYKQYMQSKRFYKLIESPFKNFKLLAIQYIDDLQFYLSDLMLDETKYNKEGEIIWQKFINQLSLDTTYLLWHNTSNFSNEAKLNYIKYKPNITYLESYNFFDDILKIVQKYCDDKTNDIEHTKNIHIQIDMIKFYVRHFVDSKLMVSTRECVLVKKTPFLPRMERFFEIKDIHVKEFKSQLPLMDGLKSLQCLPENAELFVDNIDLPKHERTYCLNQVNDINNTCYERAKLLSEMFVIEREILN